MQKKVLFYYTNPFTLKQILCPLIFNVGQVFEITIVTSNYFMPADLRDMLDRWREEGYIRRYYILPLYKTDNTEHPAGICRIHLSLQVILRSLKREAFDIIISGSSVESWDRYIMECLGGKGQKKVGIWLGGFPLPLHDYVIAGYADNYANPVHATDFFASGQDPEKTILPYESGKDAWIRRLRQATLRGFVQKFQPISAVRKVHRMYRRSCTRLHFFLDRYFLPLVLAGKTFPTGALDQVTWFDTSHFNVILTFQKLHSLVFQSLYPNARVFIAQHPNIHNCRCRSAEKPSDNVLVCLSGFDGSDTQVRLLSRDIRLVVTESGAEEIHIRPHPRESPEVLNKLLLSLREIGIMAKIVDTRQPIREIVCNYIGVVGCGTSTSLLEARASCDYAFVIGFIAIAKTYAQNPRFTFGDIEGLEQRIDWIEEDGSFQPGIMKRRKHPRPEYPDMSQVLMDL